MSKGMGHSKGEIMALCECGKEEAKYHVIDSGRWRDIGLNCWLEWASQQMINGTIELDDEVKV